MGTSGGNEGMAKVERIKPPNDLMWALEGRRSADENIIIRSIPLADIEPDPNQPRMHFDAAELQELADSLKSVGLLQEPCVYPIEVDEDGLPKRFRLHYGERRWRAAALAGWTEIRCKIIPKDADEDLLLRLKRIDQQDAENTRRAALSAVEEAKSIKVKLGTLQAANPGTNYTALVEQVARERKVDETTVWRLLGLLDAPDSLRQAILTKSITSREVAFLLSSHWKDVREKHAVAVQGKREVQFRNRVKDWVEAKGLELNAEAATKYAAEQCLDPKVVKESLRAAEKIEKGAAEAFDQVVATAVKEGWTVQEARLRLRQRKSGDSGHDTAAAAKLFERTGTKGKTKLTVFLDRVRDPQLATPDARKELAEALRALLTELDAQAAVAPVKAAG